MAEGELMTLEGAAGVTALELLNRSEIDTQVATAHKFPRSVAMFIKEASSLVGLSAGVAAECSYVLPRDGKAITGPSARFAEIIASCWGNSRAGARVINEDARFVTAQGVFHDLQRNVAITYEVKRRITTKGGKTFGDDMIGVTANAACSIALRNAILKGIPKAFWNDVYNTAIATAKGDAKTLPQRRDAALTAFAQQGFSEAEVFKLIGARGKSDVDIDKLFELSGILTALADGDTTKAELLKEINPQKLDAPAAAPPVTAKAAPVDKAPAKSPAVAAPAAQPKPAPVEVDPTEIRSPDEVLAELENVVSGIEGEADLDAVWAEYQAHAALSFPGDKARASAIIAAARERITA